MSTVSYSKILEEHAALDDDDDNEIAHIVQDEIYRKFIQDVAAGKFSSLDDAVKIAQVLSAAVIERDVDRWYA